MNVCSRLLVAVDNSQASAAAIRVTLDIARTQLQHRLRFVTVSEDEVALQAAQASHDVLADARVAAKNAGVDAETTRLVGDPVKEILTEADAWNASCIAVGTHGRTGLTQALFGSCAQGVLRHSVRPVLVVGAAHSNADLTDRILCAFDSSPAAQAAYDAAVSFAQERRATLHVVSVVELNNQYAAGYEQDHFDPDGSVGILYRQARGALDALSAGAVERGVQPLLHVIGGADVASLIAGCADKHDCGLILMGSHGGSEVIRAVLGSTASGVIGSAVAPLIVFHERLRGSAVLDRAEVLTRTLERL